MASDDEAAQIARGLTRAQREAVLWLPPGMDPTHWRWADESPECAVMCRGMPRGLRIYAPMINSFQLTPLGLRVRAALGETARVTRVERCLQDGKEAG